MFLDLYVVQLTRTSDNGSPIHGMWRGQRWIQGEALFSTERDAQVVRRRVGGHIYPFSESNMFKLLSEELQDAVMKIAKLDVDQMMATAEEKMAEAERKLAEAVEVAEGLIVEEEEPEIVDFETASEDEIEIFSLDFDEPDTDTDDEDPDILPLNVPRQSIFDDLPDMPLDNEEDD